MQNTFIRDDHANLTLACSARDADSGNFSALFPGLANPAASRRSSREPSTRRPSDVQRRDSLTQELARLKSIAQYQTGLTGMPSIFHMSGADAQALSKQEVMNFSKGTVWAEYFNNMRKCWEPLLEKLVATILYEKVMILIRR